MTFERGPLLLDAARWIRAFYGRSVVIKIGGETLERPAAIQRIARQIKVIRDCGINPLVIHGAGVQLDRACAERGISFEKVGGRRITTPPVLEALIGVLKSLNEELCESLAEQEIPVKGMADGSGELIHCVRRPPSEREGRMVDWGEVGDITGVEKEKLTSDTVWVIPSLGMALDGPKNINADACAGHCAVAIQAVKLLFLTSTPGVMYSMEDDSPISMIDAATAERLLGEGRIKGGMQAKLEESFKAIRGGVEQVHILSGRDPFGLLREIYTDEGVGTLIVK